MMDSVGGKPFSIGERSVGAVARTVPARGLEAPLTAQTKAPVAAPTSVARELAASPPVDADRVARIRRAIAEGKFPLSPATIADRLIALKMDWTGNDQA